VRLSRGRNSSRSVPASGGRSKYRPRPALQLRQPLRTPRAPGPAAFQGPGLVPIHPSQTSEFLTAAEDPRLWRRRHVSPSARHPHGPSTEWLHDPPAAAQPRTPAGRRRLGACVVAGHGSGLAASCSSPGELRRPAEAGSPRLLNPALSITTPGGRSFKVEVLDVWPAIQ
jgi:hypothetical protein